MKSTKFDRIVSFVVIGTCLIKAVLYGGSKPPASTNEQSLCASSRGRGQSLTSQTETEPSAIQNSSFTPQTSWTARGAYCDWTRVDFPDGFAFPHGTNLVTSVTLMAYGEIREDLRRSPSAFALSLPQAVSLEPDASSFAHGLTPSNSYLFAWSNVCVNRSPTNRVDASVELFPSGVCSVRFGASRTDYPPTPPPGFVGSGQDDDWLAAAFSPTDYAAITNKGYARWLDEDYVGYNEENGHCRGTVTVYSMPPNGQPCYLVCGPFKLVVTEPGEYDFPLEVLTDIHIQTYPTSVPFSFSYDEGYYPDEDDYGALLMSPRSQSNNQNNLNIRIVPAVHLTPSHISFPEMARRHVRIWCNMAQAAWEYVTLGSETARLNFHNRHDAEVLDWASTRLARILIYNRTHPEVCGYLNLIPPYIPENNPDPTNDCNSGSSPTNAPPSGTVP